MSRDAPTPDRRPRRRFVLAAVPVLLLLVFAAALGSLALDFHRSGWTGMFVLPVDAYDEGQEPPESMRGFWIWSPGPGEVILVAPDSPADRAGIRRGDEVVAVNGVPLSATAAVRSELSGLAAGDRMVFDVRRGGRDVWRLDLVRTSPILHGPTVSGLLIGFLVILVYLAIGALLGWARSRSRPARVFYVICIVIASTLFTLVYNSISSYQASMVSSGDLYTPLRLLLWAVLVVTAVAGSTLILHLALIFPRRRPLVVQRPEVLHWVHLAPWTVLLLPVALLAPLAFDDPGWPSVLRAAATAALLLPALLHLRRRQRTTGGRTGWRLFAAHPWASSALLLGGVALAAPLTELLPHVAALVLVMTVLLLSVAWAALGVPLLYTVLTLLSLGRSYRESGVEEKRQIRWPLWGLGMTLVGGLVYSLLIYLTPQFAPEMMETQGYHVCSNVLFSLIYLPLPVSFAFAIAKYRLMEIDLILRKTAVYGATTAVVLAGSLLVAGGLSLALLSWTRMDSPLVAVGATLALVALFVPVRNRMQAYVDRRLGSARRSRQEALEEVRRRVLAAASLDELLEPMAETVQQALESRAAVLLVRPPESDLLVARAKVGLPDEVVGRLTLGAAALSSAGRLAERDDLPLDDDTRARLKRLRLRLLAPARQQGQVVGAVAVGRGLEGKEPDADEREFLAAVADQLALAVGTLGPRRETRELDQARQIQESLLPAELPTVPGVELAGLWRPAREVAGDYYDVLDFGGGRAGLCIADVVGKGMPAAMTMSGLQAAVRAVAAVDGQPDRVCAQVARVVTSTLTGGKFVTFFYALLDAPKRRLAYTNAGHAPPLLLRADGTVESLETGGGALTRLLADQTFHRGTVDLHPGDTLVLYTDGVTEAQAPDGTLFGEERLVEAARRAGRQPDCDAAAVQAAVVTAVEAFSPGDAGDDLTLLVVRVPR